MLFSYYAGLKYRPWSHLCSRFMVVFFSKTDEEVGKLQVEEQKSHQQRGFEQMTKEQRVAMECKLKYISSVEHCRERLVGRSVTRPRRVRGMSRRRAARRAQRLVGSRGGGAARGGLPAARPGERRRPGSGGRAAPRVREAARQLGPEALHPTWACHGRFWPCGVASPVLARVSDQRGRPRRI